MCIWEKMLLWLVLGLLLGGQVRIGDKAESKLTGCEPRKDINGNEHIGCRLNPAKEGE